ncbi:MAG TPA: hypothetical protein DEQ02_08540 [Ruminococcaceae bacterium]|nr:hypothetical protein [Oscillospiraceae bacterium]
MKLKKSICMVLVALLILAAFTACKKEENNESGSSSDSTSQSSGDESGGDASDSESDGSDTSGGGSQAPVSIEPTTPRSDDEIKTLIKDAIAGEGLGEVGGGVEGSGGGLQEKIKDGDFDVEKVEGQGTPSIPTYTVKDKDGNTVGNIGVIGNKPVELDTGEDPEPAPIEDVVETTDENGNPIIFYSYVTATDPERYEVGVAQNEESFHSLYVGVNTQYNPRLKKGTDGKVFITVTDGGEDLDICSLTIAGELGYKFVHLDYTDVLLNDPELTEKYIIVVGSAG